MKNLTIAALRREYNALLLIADGLIDMIYSHDACNVLTFSRMSSEARAAARHLASEVERLVLESSPAPIKKDKHTIREIVFNFVSKVANSLAGKIATLAAA